MPTLTYEEALDRFIELLTARQVKHYAEKFPNLPAETFALVRGSKYDKIIQYRHDGSRCSFCMIDKKTGGILKSNWKGLCKPKVERGNIFNDADPLAGTTVYGTVYLR